MHKTFEQIGEALKSCHFKGSGKFYHRASNNHVILVQFKSATEGEGFIIDYGRHPLIDDSIKVHHRDYHIENCSAHHCVKTPKGGNNWPYHMNTEGLSELISRLLTGINALENH